MPVGVRVTLRGDKMYEFLDRLITVALPRVRDFRGINGRSFDGRGNYALGITEHLIFPEINFDKVDKTRGMDIVVCTTASNDEQAKELLKGFDFPFKRKKTSRERVENMAKTSSVERNDKRKRLVKKHAGVRARLKETIKDKDAPMEERFQAVLKLSELPKNSSKIRVRNRCALTGRARGNFRKFNLSRNMLRELALRGELPGVTKSSW